MKKSQHNLHNLCLRILKIYECERDCYKGQDIHEAEEGIKEELSSPSNKTPMNPFTAKEIASELIAIGNAVLNERKDKYHLIWDTDNCTDGYDVGNNKKSLKDAMENCLLEWMMQFGDQEDKSTDAWDYMIYNCGCACYRNEDLHPDVDLDRIESYGLTANELKKIGWVLVEDMPDETYDSYAHAYGWPKRDTK